MTIAIRDPAELLAAAMAATAVGGREGGAQHRMRWRDGSTAKLDVARWLADPTAEERELLARVSGPALDVGCGPGRLVAALARRGVDALGIDVLPQALQSARLRGAAVLERSVFDDVPRTGQWGTVLLLDGNIGIGGDAVALMRRVHVLLRPQGSAVVELEAPGVGLQRGDGRLETPDGHSACFRWGRVGVDAVDLLAARAGFTVTDVRYAGDRWFADLAAGGTNERARGLSRSRAALPIA